MDISYNYAYQFRVDTSKNDYLVPIIEDSNCTYYIGKHELSTGFRNKFKKPKAHYQMCLFFNEEPNEHYWRNIKKKKWVSDTYQPLSFTKARKLKSLLSYVTKEDGELITNMQEYSIKTIPIWEKKILKQDRYKYIFEWGENLKKKYYNNKYQPNELSSEDYNYSLQNTYDEEPEEYEISTKPSQKIMEELHREYFRKFKVQIVKHTMIKLMLDLGLISHKHYLKCTLGKLLY